MLTEESPPLTDSGLIAMLAQYGIGPGLNFDEAMLSAASIRGLTRAVAHGSALGLVANGAGRKRVGDWNYGSFGSDTIQNAARARFRAVSFALDPQEVVYISSAKLLTGEQKYILRFGPDQFPPTNAFWSLTIYQGSGGLTPNPINRYSIGDRSDHLKFEPDGSLELLVQTESPGNELESNWLPTPPGSFRLVLRGYRPKPELLEGNYLPPSIEEAL